MVNKRKEGMVMDTINSLKVGSGSLIDINICLIEKVNELVRKANGQSALIQLQKDEIDKLKDWQKEVEKTYPFMCQHSTLAMVNEATNEQKDICKKCGKDLTPKTDGEKFVKWFREYNGI